MHVDHFRCILGVLIVLLTHAGWAQEQLQWDYDEVPLAIVLQDIEQQSDLIFSYSDAVIADKKITLKKNLTVTELLVYLQSTTGLLFEPIGENQVIISAPDPRISVCGYLFDQVTKSPLAYATILIKGTNTGYTSDENGLSNGNRFGAHSRSH